VIVRKVRGQNKVGKVLLSRSEVELVQKMGIPLEEYVKTHLVRIAKERRWKWYFEQQGEEP
jgi:hypothetical protein